MLVSWNTTNQCNMFCDHCYRDAGAKAADELDTNEARTLIEEIKKAGFKIMIFSGGEPLLRPDIYELGAYARQQGLRPVLGTNATLITPKTAHQLKEAGFLAAGVSLDTLIPEKNDAFRKLENTSELTMNGINNLKEAGIPFQIHTTVMDWNVDELEAITDFAVELGAMAHHVFFLVPTGRAVNIEEEALRVEIYEKTIARLMEKQKNVPIEIKPTCAPQFIRVADKKGIPLRFSRGCLAGISYCIISPKGDVQPCAYMNMYLGNVREIPFHQIWSDNPVLKELRTMDYEGKCGICDYKTSCGGCRARANYYNGSIMSEDSWCLYNPSRKA
ncbi:Aldolase-type TIM barrel [Syntrophomonas zehnderi OL-4]|uniref:Aldolase-type TIM barrel n=1 Tax=Syntrophomonas zehnderi OL-4 TaxID=690567 RepID=A0A0E4GBK6_9FIRM|nr:putative heme d1 biosynthesis radical SAM protein NirJ2 [Syntrophomonas zehnderi]CFX92350.1 Aldolase-type TIM barrel [Syntrophomonas zehnderi OL-4]